MKMRSCPRCEASLDDDARFCVDCGAPQSEAAAEELDEYVQEQAEQVVAASGMDVAGGADGSAGGGNGDGAASDSGSSMAAAATEALTDREQLWRRCCYAAGYGTIAIALTMVPTLHAWPLMLGGIVILPPIRRLTIDPLGLPLKREVMAGLYALLVLIGIALFVLY